jgi:hypothetical protein
MFELSDPDRGLLEQTYALRFRLKFARQKVIVIRLDGDIKTKGSLVFLEI